MIHTVRSPARGFRTLPLPQPALMGLIALVLLLPEMGAAQEDAGGILDGSLTAMRDRLSGLGETMAGRAQSLMLWLLVIDFVIRFGRYAIRNDPLELMMQDWAYSLGFVAVAWGMAEAIPEVVIWLGRIAREMSSVAGAADVRPSNLVTDGIARAVGWLGEISFINPGTWFYIFAAIVSLLALSITVAMLVITYAELYLVGLAGIITLGFAGLAQTQSVATGFFMQLVGKAMKLFGILVVVAATGEITTAIAEYGGTGIVAGFEAAMMMILLQVITGMLILTLPGTLEKLVAGAAVSSGAESVGKKVGDYGMAAGGVAARKTGALIARGGRAVKGRLGR